MSVMDEFIQEIQRRNLFAQIAVTQAGCFGPCQHGANVLVYPEGIMYGKVTRADVKTIIDEHLLGGTVVQALCVPAEAWG
jgi:(2Fe-2S) ferredoxin